MSVSEYQQQELEKETGRNQLSMSVWRVERVFKVLRVVGWNQTTSEQAFTCTQFIKPRTLYLDMKR